MNTKRVQFLLRLVVSGSIVITSHLMLVATASGEQRFYYDKNGNSIGNSISNGNQTFFYDRNGNLAGNSINYGNQSYYYDQNGNTVGNSLSYGDALTE